MAGAISSGVRAETIDNSTPRARPIPQDLKMLGSGDVGIGERGDVPDAGHRLHQDILPLAVEFRREQADAGGVAARPPKRRHQPVRHHVVGRRKYGNRLRRRLRGAGGNRTRTDDRVGRRFDERHSGLRKLFVAQTESARDDREILAAVEARPAQFFKECSDVRRLARAAAQEADTVDAGRLLRGERRRHAERCRCATEKPDELAAPHASSLTHGLADHVISVENDSTSGRTPSVR
jgi:hypothetical protein